MLQGTDKTPALISDYKEYHTDSTVKFVVRMSEEKLAQAEAVGLHKVFKLQSSLTCNSMVKLVTVHRPPRDLFAAKPCCPSTAGPVRPHGLLKEVRLGPGHPEGVL